MAICHHRDPGGKASSVDKDEQFLCMLRLRCPRNIQVKKSNRLSLAVETGAQRERTTERTLGLQMVMETMGKVTQRENKTRRGEGRGLNLSWLWRAVREADK